MEISRKYQILQKREQIQMYVFWEKQLFMIYQYIYIAWYICADTVKWNKVYTSLELLIPICNLPFTWFCSYQWRKDDVAVRNSRQVAVDSKLGTIVFTRIDMSDYGTYQCFASNQYGTALSPPIEVHEARKSINFVTF